ncbi:MAG: phenylacetate--CoA ligase family protein, partial [Candidatus Rokubacteria bacterium]|nr:phenylacetate--CoA ligase family protein [Candidatus Rokubacteria bacterium]
MTGTVPFFDRDLETLPRERLRALQLGRLRALCQEVWAGNAFWRKKWQSCGVSGPEDLASWDDFLRLPFTVKRELVQDQLATPPFGSNLTYPLERYVRLH